MVMSASRPRISRDTRWLLIVVVVSVIALSLLARVRFGNADRITGPIAPVISQLQPRSPFTEMSATIEGLLPRLRDAVAPLSLTMSAEQAPEVVLPAVRFRDGFVVAFTPPDALTSSASTVAFDRVTRLVVARSADSRAGSVPFWEPIGTAQSTFFVAVRVASGHVVARPIFVSALVASPNPRWPNPVFALAGTSAIEPGTLLFTLEGALAGLVAGTDGPPILVPASMVVREAERVLSAAATQQPGRLDIDVQPLSNALMAATGAPQGVVVSWVSLTGPIPPSLKVGDVIIEVSGAPISSLDDWRASLDRISAGQSVPLTVWRTGERSAVTLVAGGDEPADRIPLGLQLRTLPATGASIRHIVAHGAADRAGLRRGDVLTRIGDLDAPTAVQAERAFRAATTERPLLLGVTRGETHFVLAMERRW